MDEIEPHDPWAASDGLPEVADDDSYADSVHEAARDPNEPSALPPDREDGPLGLEEYGVGADQGLRGEPLDARLRRETPDTGGEGMEPHPRIVADLDLDEPGLGGRADPRERVAEDSRLVAEHEPVDPRLGSKVSVYDRPEQGVGDYPAAVGEIVRPGSGYNSYERDEVGFDLGSGLGGLGNEEQAMHEIPQDEAALEESQSTSEPYVLPERTYVVRTGSEQQWDPEDLAVAEGRDPTPRNVERARRELEELGPAAIEKTVP